MKKTSAKNLLFIILCFTIVTACTLCLSKSAEPSNVAIYGAEDHEKIQEFLSTYPIESATANGCFVLVHGDIRGDSKKTWNTFYSNVNNENDAAILIVQYTIEGDPILNYVSFVNGSFYSVRDNSRDAWGGPDPYHSGSYQFLKVFKTKGYTEVMLFDVDYDTLEDYENDTQFLPDIDDYDNEEDYFKDYENHMEAVGKKSVHLFSTWGL